MTQDTAGYAQKILTLIFKKIAIIRCWNEVEIITTKMIPAKIFSDSIFVSFAVGKVDAVLSFYQVLHSLTLNLTKSLHWQGSVGQAINSKLTLGQVLPYTLNQSRLP
jgi:hypothetical protein